MNTLFLEPLDVLYLRGNKLFGEAGTHGEALMPPWPSMLAGALRSRLMDEGETLDSLVDFRLTHFGLAQRVQSPKAALQPLWPLPADVVVSAEDLSSASYLRPQPLPTGLVSSYPLPQLPTLCVKTPAKPVSGLWLNAKGIAAWLNGQPIATDHMLRSSELWKLDSRLGIALDTHKRSAADGKIFTSEAVALAKDIGFAATSNGHQKHLKDGDLVKLGGDGRAARVQVGTLEFPETDWDRIQGEGRFRLILTSPGLFPHGWQPDVPGTLISAAVSRADTISGWNLVTRQPKPAQRVAPAGSVYWYECPCKLADLEKLKLLADNGLPINDPMRRAEGFNHCHIAPWA